MQINRINKFILLWLMLIIVSLATGCATPESRVDNPDPYESANRVSYDVTESLDRNLVKPIAEVYKNVTPDLMRAGVTNFFDNLAYLNVILNWISPLL